MNSRISELTLKNLRQQMNPHFIFNTLNSIQYYMYQHDKIATNDYMSKFSSLMRKTLENSRHTSIPIKDELDALTLYLELEALRFKHKFSYVIVVDDEIDLLMHKIPTMLIQPYVENAIGHGLMHKEGSDGLVKIKLKLNETTIICTVQDNGIGREAAHKINLSNKSHHSMGTTITESRLKIVNSLYGKNMRIDYFDLKTPDDSPAGTKVVIHIPIIT
jgi:LytS/YehU family sensor histidine kinase